MTQYSESDVPEDVRERDVTSDEALSTEEKEVRIVGSKPDDSVVCSTEIPTLIKWLQSIEESDFEWVRTNGEGAIVAAQATVPKGIVKLQGRARQSNTHSQMVTYGDEVTGGDSS